MCSCFYVLSKGVLGGLSGSSVQKHYAILFLLVTIFSVGIVFGCSSSNQSPSPQLVIERAKAMLEINPKDPVALTLWGNALTELDRYGEATDKYAEAVQYCPDCAETWHSWGRTFAALGNYQEAVKKYEEAVKHDSGLGGAWYDWGTALSELEKR